MADKQQIIIERKINAPVERVWKALTDIHKLQQWCSFWPDFKAEVGFKTEFMLGPDKQHKYLHHVEVQEVIPNRRLAYAWDYGGMSPNSRVSFKLVREGDATRLMLTCDIDPLPSDRLDFMAGTEAGWNFTVEELETYLNKE